MILKPPPSADFQFLSALPDVPLRVRVSPRARRMALRFDAAAEGIELVLPKGVPLAVGLDFAASHREWVANRLAALPPRIPFADGAEVPILGVPHIIRHRPGRGRVAVENGAILVAGEAPHVPRRVRDHLASLARHEIGARARALAARIGRRVGRISVRDPKSRWGSCSATGNLAFSWRLILAPETVLHYVVAHEVAHLVEMNHGPRFWRLVEELAPGSAAHREWLNQNRSRLLRYG